MMTTILAATSGLTFPPEFIKHAINALTRPAIFLSLSSLIFVVMLVAYRTWTKPLIAGGLFVLFCIFYFGSLADPNFAEIVRKPDNVPITIMVVSVMICIWLAFRRAALNDSRIEAVLPLLEEDRDDKVLVWPDLVYTELLCLILATAGLMLW